MAMKQAILLGASLMLAVPATAQEAAEQTFQEEEAKTAQRAVNIYWVFNSILTQDDIPQAEKDQVLGCLYDNDLKSISLATGALLAENPEVDASTANGIYSAAAWVCGVRPAESGDAAPAPAE